MEIKETDIAWAAGLFEGEGCIQPDYEWTGKGRGEGKRRVKLCLSLNMTDVDVVERFVSIVQCGRVRALSTDNAWTKPHWKPQFSWEIAGRRDTLKVMAMFLPYLGNRRRQKLIETLSQIDGIDLRTNTRTSWADDLEDLRRAASSL